MYGSICHVYALVPSRTQTFCIDPELNFRLKKRSIYFIGISGSSIALSACGMRLLLIDNYDSYTHNIVHLFAQVCDGSVPTVVRADAYPSFKALTRVLGKFHAIVISPGPGSPHSDRDFAALPADALRQQCIPVFGVCLGHQALCVAYGANVVRAPGGPVHGQISAIKLDSRNKSTLFDGIPSQFQVVRYHSLVVDPFTLPDQIVPTAWSADGSTLMAVQHAQFPQFGVQFHPESVSTDFGQRIAANFVALVKKLTNFRDVPVLPLRKPGPRRSERKNRSLCRDNLEQLEVIVHSILNIHADTQVIFSRLFHGKEHCFWLDSSSSCASASSMSRCSSPSFSSTNDHVQTSRGRFSIMGDAEGPRAQIVTYSTVEKCVRIMNQSSGIWEHQIVACSIFQYLKEQLEKRKILCPEVLPLEMNGGYVGFFGYELKKEMCGVSLNRHSSDLPDAWFLFADRVIIFDHEKDQAYLAAIVGCGPSSESEVKSARDWFSSVERQILLEPVLSIDSHCTQSRGFNLHPSDEEETLCFSLERSKSQYLEDIRSCLGEIVAGESYEVCLTNRLRTRFPDTCNLDPCLVYSTLRLVNPAPYASFLRLSKDVAICCSSPERFLQINSDGYVESKPIKGTTRRGDSLETDKILRNELANSVKDRSENLMIVDLVRNDLSQTCETGSISVPHLMHVESFATVHQLVSTIRGKLADGNSCVDCIKAAYPMGSMTGAPKVRTLDIIDRLEHSARGIYSGSIGYLSLCGAADLNVVIRTAVLNGPTIEVGVGGAIIALSDAEDEFEEVLMKGSAIMQAIGLAVTGRSDYVLSTGE